jgi:hypothetical protein
MMPVSAYRIEGGVRDKDVRMSLSSCLAQVKEQEPCCRAKKSNDSTKLLVKPGKHRPFGGKDELEVER